MTSGAMQFIGAIALLANPAIRAVAFQYAGDLPMGIGRSYYGSVPAPATTWDGLWNVRRKLRYADLGRTFGFARNNVVFPPHVVPVRMVKIDARCG
jgi:hypothetical protein